MKAPIFPANQNEWLDDALNRAYEQLARAREMTMRAKFVATDVRSITLSAMQHDLDCIVKALAGGQQLKASAWQRDAGDALVRIAGDGSFAGRVSRSDVNDRVAYAVYICDEFIDYFDHERDAANFVDQELKSDGWELE